MVCATRSIFARLPPQVPLPSSPAAQMDPPALTAQPTIPPENGSYVLTGWRVAGSSSRSSAEHHRGPDGVIGEDLRPYIEGTRDLVRGGVDGESFGARETRHEPHLAEADDRFTAGLLAHIRGGDDLVGSRVNSEEPSAAVCRHPDRAVPDDGHRRRVACKATSAERDRRQYAARRARRVGRGRHRLPGGRSRPFRHRSSIDWRRSSLRHRPDPERQRQPAG